MRRGERGACLRLIGGAAGEGEVEVAVAGDCGAPGSLRCRFAAKVLRSAESCAWVCLATPDHDIDAQGEESTRAGRNTVARGRRGAQVMKRGEVEEVPLWVASSGW